MGRQEVVLTLGLGVLLLGGGTLLEPVFSSLWERQNQGVSWDVHWLMYGSPCVLALQHVPLSVGVLGRQAGKDLGSLRCASAPCIVKYQPGVQDRR